MPSLTNSTEPLKATRTKTKGMKPVNKSDSVTKLLARAKGATVADLIDATGWQPHSVRALLSGLRKKGVVLIRDARKSGESCYRMGGVQPNADKGVKRASEMPKPDDSAFASVAPATATEVA